MPDGSKYRIGKCPFEGGCNGVWFWHPGDNDDNGNLDCLLRTRWISRDYGGHDDNNPNSWTGKYEPTDEYIDWAETLFDANTTKVSKNNYKFEKQVNYPIICSAVPKPEGNLVSTIAVDPLLGPETEAFFDEVNTRLQQQPMGEAMGEDTTTPCDFDGDGDCDDADRSFFWSRIGIYRGQDYYHPFADSDADGCITPDDEPYLFVTDTDEDGLPDDQDECPNSIMDSAVVIDACNSNVANYRM